MAWNILTLVVLVALAMVANAQRPMRCDGRLVDPGDPLAQVLALCGDPAEQFIEEVPIRARNVDGTTRVIGFTLNVRLVYARGWGRFPAVLQFEDGVLQRIDYFSVREPVGYR
jgi:hypothetical protein